MQANNLLKKSIWISLLYNEFGLVLLNFIWCGIST